MEVKAKKNFNNPLVSVVVPTLNRSHYLIPTIDSILNQDYPNIECIVVDGGSTDESVDILKSYGHRIKWISEPDNGHADAINKGWKMSKGEILAWLNADDVWKVPEGARKAVEYFIQHPELDVIYGNCDRIDAEGNITGRNDSFEWDLEYAVEYCHHLIHQPAAFIKRSVLKKVGWLDTKFHQKNDHELWLRIGLQGKIKHIPVLLAYTRDIKGLSFDAKRIASSCLQVTKKFFSFPHLPERIKKKKRRAFSNSYLRGANYAYLCGLKYWPMAITYIFRAFITDPLNLPYILHRTTLPLRRKLIGLFSRT